MTLEKHNRYIPQATTATIGLVLSILCGFLFTSSAYADQGICLNTTKQVARQYSLPQYLLGSIALTESGRWDKSLKTKVAWPWTVTSGGKGEYFQNKNAAIAHVRKLKNAGVTNIDVGCMQINLWYHPDAFASLSDAFDPKTNVQYAAKFLSNLKSQWGSWREAVRRYHSADLSRGHAYEQRVTQNKSDLRTTSYATMQPAHRALNSKSHNRKTPELVQAERAKAKAEAAAWRKRKLAEYMARKAARNDG